MTLKYYTLLFSILLSTHLSAAEFITTEPSGESYQYTSNYRISINASPGEVWSHLENLKSWMYDFALTHHSGQRGRVGETLQLYPNQDFFVQVTAKIEEQLLTIANLPVSFNGELSTGVGVINIVQAGEQSVVNLTLSRRYTWQGDGENQMKAKRQSSEFQEGSGSVWNKFLQKLKELSERA